MKSFNKVKRFIEEKALIKYLTKCVRKGGIPHGFYLMNDGDVVIVPDSVGAHDRIKKLDEQFVIALFTLGKIVQIRVIGEYWCAKDNYEGGVEKAIEDGNYVRPSEDPNQMEAVHIFDFTKKGDSNKWFDIVRNGKKVKLKLKSRNKIDTIGGFMAAFCRHWLDMSEKLGNLHQLGKGTLYKIKQAETEIRKRVQENSNSISDISEFKNIDGSKHNDFVGEIFSKWKLTERDMLVLSFKQILRRALLNTGLFPEKKENFDVSWDPFEKIEGAGL